MHARILLALVAFATGCGDSDLGGVVATGTDPLPDAGGVADDTGRVGDDVGNDDRDTIQGGCAPDECEIDGACVVNETANAENPCEICLVVVAKAEWSADDTAECDDGDPCTSEDVCVAGDCEGAVTTCDDGDPCTDDLCDAETGACSVLPGDGALCDDRDPCTVGDVCAVGVCAAGTQALGCDDGNGCTSDRCEPRVGCIAEAVVGLECDDGDLCTLGDACGEDGRCLPGTDELECEDGSLCTVDFCDPGEGCVFEDVSPLCDDENPCTDARCEPERGCIYPFNVDPCDDGNACTEADVCGGGVCRGRPINLNDGNLCTDVTCDPLLGVRVAPNNLPCDNSDACTVQDRCGEGLCQPGAARECDDGNACTDNECDSDAGCTYPNKHRRV